MRGLFLLLLTSCLLGDTFAIQCHSADKPSGEVRRSQYVVSAIQKWNAWLSEIDRRAKYRKMNVSALAFFRGTNHLYWADMTHSKIANQFGSATTKTWIHGDLHVENFGALHNARGEIVYDFDDFDDSLIADFQFDLMRLATSILLVSRSNQLDADEERRIIDSVVTSYLQTLRACRDSNVELNYAVTLPIAFGKLDEFLGEVAGTQSRAKMLEANVVTTSGRPRFIISLDRLQQVDASTWQKIEKALIAYSKRTSNDVSKDEFVVKDVARRVFMGTGSLGVARYFVLVEGPTTAADDDRILDIKAQRLPTGYRYTAQSVQDQQLHQSSGRRHQVAYQSLVPHADTLLGWLELDGQQYSVRERSPFKQTFPVEELDSVTRLEKLSQQWGKITAVRHARADKDADVQSIPYEFEDEVMEAVQGREREFSRYVFRVASAYARRVRMDFDTFQKALDDGQLR